MPIAGGVRVEREGVRALLEDVCRLTFSPYVNPTHCDEIHRMTGFVFRKDVTPPHIHQNEGPSMPL